MGEGTVKSFFHRVMVDLLRANESFYLKFLGIFDLEKMLFRRS